MELFQLTRYEMAQLLLSLGSAGPRTPTMILQEAWAKSHKNWIDGGRTLSALMSTSLPPIFDKMMNGNIRETGLSLNEIVALGAQIEYSQYAITAVQNWVKRDLKDIIGTPKIGKKYSIEQAAILFIIEDLRSALDLESIRKLLLLIFHEYDNEARDLISPVELYAGYSAIFEEMDKNNDQVMDLQGQGDVNRKHDHMMGTLIKKRADEFAQALTGLREQQVEAVSNIMVIAILSVQTAYFQTLAKRFLQATLFIQALR